MFKINNYRFFDNSAQSLFSLAVVWAILVPCYTVCVIVNNYVFPNSIAFNIYQWHGYEMMFGYIYMMIAGLILTASIHWNNAVPKAAGHMGFLCLLFVLEKVSILANFKILYFLASLIFALDLFYLLNKQLGSNRLKYLLLFITSSLSFIKCLFLANTIFKLNLNNENLYNVAQILILILVSVVIERVIPDYTKKKLKLVSAPKAPWFINIASIVFSITLFMTLFEFVPIWLKATLYFLAFLFQFIRLLFWKPLLTMSSSTIASLHFANLFFVAGFLFKVFLYLNPDLDIFRASFHFQMMGGVTLVGFGIMIFSAYEHTGRITEFKFMEKLIFACLTSGVLVRVFGPVFFPQHFGMALHNGMGLWTFAFILFAIQYILYIFKDKIKKLLRFVIS
jgi:uncharacterized protein involved in response to NO